LELLKVPVEDFTNFVFLSYDLLRGDRIVG
jgi:hypothetical protein